MGFCKILKPKYASCVLAEENFYIWYIFYKAYSPRGEPVEDSQYGVKLRDLMERCMLGLSEESHRGFGFVLWEPWSVWGIWQDACLPNSWAIEFIYNNSIKANSEHMCRRGRAWRSCHILRSFWPLRRMGHQWWTVSSGLMNTQCRALNTGPSRHISSSCSPAACWRSFHGALTELLLYLLTLRGGFRAYQAQLEPSWRSAGRQETCD